MIKQSAWRTVMGILLLGIVTLISRQAETPVSVQNHRMDVDKAKPVAITDVEHGGNDPDKVGINGQLEKDINLEIAQRLKEYLEVADVKVALTRNLDQGFYNSDGSHKKMADMHRRCEVIDEVNPDLAVNIHQNNYHEEYAPGSQVFYCKTSEKGKYPTELLQKGFDYVLGEANKRLVKVSDNYYLPLHVKAPIVIVECGFLSNSKEAARLEEGDYQDRMAWTIHMGILQHLNTVGNQTAEQ